MVSCHKNGWETEKQVLLNKEDCCLSFQQPHHMPVHLTYIKLKFLVSHPRFGQIYHYFNMLLLIQLIPYTPLEIMEVALTQKQNPNVTKHGRQELGFIYTHLCRSESHQNENTKCFISFSLLQKQHSNRLILWCPAQGFPFQSRNHWGTREETKVASTYHENGFS